MKKAQCDLTMELAKYRPVPGNIQADVIAERKAECSRRKEKSC
jgi:hypothetical protein